MKKNFETILKKYSNAESESFTPILKKTEDNEGFISEKSVVRVGEYLKIPASKIFGVSTFLSQSRIICWANNSYTLCGTGIFNLLKYLYGRGLESDISLHTDF